MRKVCPIGIGQIKVDEHWDKSIRVLAGDAGLAALNDAHMEVVDSVFVSNMMSNNANFQAHLGALVTDWIGLRFSEGVKIEAACGSGAAAFRAATLAIASGDIDSALVIGVEKMTDSPGSEITSALATAADADWEVDMGLSFVALNALIMQRYMHEYGWSRSDFAAFSINAHNNGVHNPYARFNNKITREAYNKAGLICDPINLLDSSPIGDGAAAIVLVAEEKVNTNLPHIIVAGSAAATDTISIHNRKNPLVLSAAETSCKNAYAQCGISPADIGVFEYHDAFTIMASLSLEACGFAERGQAPRVANNDELSIHGRIPVATFGGLKARGHPVGATGVYQLVEVIQQLRGQAGETQVPRNTYGMAQNIGGSGSNILTHILKREN